MLVKFIKDAWTKIKKVVSEKPVLSTAAFIAICYLVSKKISPNLVNLSDFLFLLNHKMVQEVPSIYH